MIFQQAVSVSVVACIKQRLHISDGLSLVGGVEFVEKFLHFGFGYACVVEEHFFSRASEDIVDGHAVHIGEVKKSVCVGESATAFPFRRGGVTDATAVRTERREISAFSFARMRRKAAGEKPRGERLRDGKGARAAFNRLPACARV